MEPRAALGRRLPKLSGWGGGASILLHRTLGQAFSCTALCHHLLVTNHTTRLYVGYGISASITQVYSTRDLATRAPPVKSRWPARSHPLITPRTHDRYLFLGPPFSGAAVVPDQVSHVSHGEILAWPSTVRAGYRVPGRLQVFRPSRVTLDTRPIVSETPTNPLKAARRV